MKHKVVIVAELNNGHRYKEDDIKSAIHVLEAHGWIGYYKNVGISFSMRELMTKTLEDIWEVVKDSMKEGDRLLGQ